MVRLRASQAARSESLCRTFSGIGTLERLRATVATAMDPPINRAAGGIERPLKSPSFTTADTNSTSAPRPMPSRTARSDAPDFLVSGRNETPGMADPYAAVSTDVRSTLSCTRSLAPRPEAATSPSIA